MPEPVLFSDHFFRLTIPGIEIGMFRECSGLSMEFDVFEWAEGGNNEFVHHLPGRMRYPYLTLTRGLTDQTNLQQWFWRTRQRVELKEVTVELHAPGGEATRAWTFGEGYPVRWTGPRVAADAAGIATETLDIAHSGMKVA